MSKSKNSKPKTADEDIKAGRRLRKIRTDKGFSQAQVAKSIEKSYQQIQKYEKGQNKIPSLNLFKMADFLKVSVYKFYDGRQIPVKSLSIRHLETMGSSQEEDIESALQRNFDRHIDCLSEAMETDIHVSYDSPTAYAYSNEIRLISARRIIRMGLKIIDQLENACNDHQARELSK